MEEYSDYFTVQKGVRQGDPLSGLLFIIAMEPLLRCLKGNKLEFSPELNNHHIPLSAYADNLSVFVRHASKVKFVKEVLSKFETTSGLKVNAKKNTYTTLL